MDKIIFLTLVFLLGFVLGLNTHAGLYKNVANSKIEQKIDLKTEVQTLATVQKDVTTAKRIVFVDKYYSPNKKNHIVKESVAVVTENAIDNSIINTASNVTSNLKSDKTEKLIYEPIKKWGFGFLMKPKNYKSIPKNFDALISYKILPSVNLLASTNVNFNNLKLNGKVGFMIDF